MRIPILVTMSWPERLPCSDDFCPRLDFVKMGDLTFKAPDNAKYPAMQLAYSAGRAGGTMTGVLSAANEQVYLQACAFSVYANNPLVLSTILVQWHCIYIVYMFQASQNTAPASACAQFCHICVLLMYLPSLLMLKEV